MSEDKPTWVSLYGSAPRIDLLGEHMGDELTFRWVPSPDQCEHEWRVVDTITYGQHEARLAEPFEVCPRCRWFRGITLKS